MNRKKIVILGGVRYIGLACTRLLLKAGCEVVTVTRHAIDSFESLHRHRICDRKNGVELSRLINEEKPDVILDMVCFDQSDGEGICNLYQEGSITHKMTYIMVSSFYVYNYGTPFSMPFSEDVSDVIDGYTRRKIEAEQMIHTLVMNGVAAIVRLPFVFSSDDYTGRFQRFCDLAEEGEIRKAAINDRVCTMITKESAALALKKIILGEAKGYLDVANPGCLSFFEMLGMIAETREQVCTESDRDALPVQDIYHLDQDICVTSFVDSCVELLSLDEALKLEAKNYFEGKG